MPRSPAKSLTSTAASPRALRSLPAISGKATKERVVPPVLASDQAVCSPTTRCRITPGTVRALSEMQGRDPLILLLARGNYCPKQGARGDPRGTPGRKLCRGRRASCAAHGAESSPREV